MASREERPNFNDLLGKEFAVRATQDTQAEAARVKVTSVKEPGESTFPISGRVVADGYGTDGATRLLVGETANFKYGDLVVN